MGSKGRGLDLCAGAARSVLDELLLQALHRGIDPLLALVREVWTSSLEGLAVLEAVVERVAALAAAVLVLEAGLVEGARAGWGGADAALLEDGGELEGGGGLDGSGEDLDGGEGKAEEGSGGGEELHFEN